MKMALRTTAGLAAAWLGLAAGLSTGRSGEELISGPTLSAQRLPGTGQVPVEPDRAILAAADAGVALAATVVGGDGSSDPLWLPIKDDTYDRRRHFAAGASQLSAKLDDEIAQLRAKRASMITDTKDWDIAMQEVTDSRNLLSGRFTELGEATTPDAWVTAKDNFRDAWIRSQLAIEAIRKTVTD